MCGRHPVRLSSASPSLPTCFSSVPSSILNRTSDEWPCGWILRTTSRPCSSASIASPSLPGIFMYDSPRAMRVWSLSSSSDTDPLCRAMWSCTRFDFSSCPTAKCFLPSCRKICAMLDRTREVCLSSLPPLRSMNIWSAPLYLSSPCSSEALPPRLTCTAARHSCTLTVSSWHSPLTLSLIFSTSLYVARASRHLACRMLMLPRLPSAAATSLLYSPLVLS
mmetsp:Transcript_10573/g.26161  ORF Transcript_10573/g.26161 Transcript_10573/m.26161 type:complete len:221 (-) Transcript_10573:482-1144(-)